MENFAFISYSSQDKHVADAVCHYLEEHNIACWIAPRDILPGKTWAGSIIKAIRECSAMVLIYSQSSNSSSQVANEIDKAFSNNKPIIPFMTDATPLNDDYEYYLSRKHWLVAYPEFKSMFPDLLKAVSAIVPSSIPSVSKINDANKDSSPILEIEKSDESNQSNSDTAQFNPIWKPDSSDTQRKVINDILNNMVLIKGGRLKLGATEEQLKWAKKDEKPAHIVELSSYWINKYAVTQLEWKTIIGINPSKYKGDNKPVEQVSLDDCREFVNKLTELSGINFALPTEAQWEYAARGGTESKGFIYSGSNDLKEVAWEMWDSGETHEVGLKKSNELGLYDMSGNVSEWCDEKKGKYTSEFVKNPHNIYKSSFWTSDNYIYRGGDHISTHNCRVSYRASSTSDYKSYTIGMRLVINMSEDTN